MIIYRKFLVREVSSLQKILIADYSEVLVQALTEGLHKEFEIRSCSNGREALTQIWEFKPDLLILNVILSEIDGVQVLKLVRASGWNLRVLLITPNLSSYVSEIVSQFQVDFAMSMPYDIDCLINRTRGILHTDTKPVDYLKFQQQTVEQLLMTLKFPVSRRGTKLLIKIIPEYAQDPTLSLTKNLYSDAGRIYGGNAAQVERAIRKVIEDTWMHADVAIWRLFFAPDGSGYIPRPTNKEFISAIAQAMKNSIEKS